MAAGWSNPDFGEAVREGLMGWVNLVTEQARQLISGREIGDRVNEREIAALVASAFLGAESAILLGLEDKGVPFRESLRNFGKLIEAIETET